MKIAVITGSPHRNGTSMLLADRFIEGAKESGHEVFRFDAAFEKVSPCQGCDFCRNNATSCIHKDSMEKLNPELLAAEMVVFVTPLYYFGMSAQMKTVIDRFYANNKQLLGSGKKAVLLATAHDSTDKAMQALIAHYRAILHYLQWNDAGILLATGCGIRDDIERTEFPMHAYKMGKEIM